MINQIKNIFHILFILIPLSLISGPAIPDLTITFGGIFMLIWFFIKEKDYNIINNDFIKISFIFWLTLIFISFFSFNKKISFQDSIIFLRYLLIPICCYFIFFEKNKFLNYLIFVVFILTILVSIDTLFQFFNYSSENGFGRDILGFKSDWYGRLTGPFGDELIPGSYVSRFGLIGFVFLLVNKKLKKKTLFQSIYLATVLVVCFVSGERMAFATFALALIILLIFLKNYRFVLIMSILVGITSIFIIYKLHPFYNDYKVVESTQFHQGLKIEKSFVCEDDPNQQCYKIINIQPSFLKIIKNFSTSAYGEIYTLSLKMFADNPITGIGISNYNYLCNENIDYNKMMINYDCASHPHNTYIQWLTEGGLIVFIFFLIYLIYIFKFIVNNTGDKNFKIISIALLIIMFWPIMSTGSLIKNWYGISVFFIIGISLCLSRLKKDF